MDFFKIKNIDSLLRDYYQVSEAAQLIGCDKKDILWYACHKNIELCMEFDDGEFDVSCGLSAGVDNHELIQSINNLPKDNEGYFILSENCSFRSDINETNLDAHDLLICNMKGYFALSNDYKSTLLKYEGQPEEWPDYFIPSGESYLGFPVELYLNYDERENYFLIDTLWITKNQIDAFLKAVAEDKKPKKTVKNYQSQSEAQKQKHAVPRAEILMAVISLFHRDMRLRRESPAAVAEQLFLHAREFWPEKGEPPLSYDTVVSLLRSCMKKEGLTFI
ncbi:hypothetical protein [Erwinia sp. QL-Z3]|uniref:hypothetical protein n=1 Tax=Erwinia sp. QL-Z3 TaxID=2547962 RepID=UPI001070CA5A|nr:hypothetical protein [Erwinia sp. QL-Z3]QBR49689.1 hypothetical protein E2F51_06605 [Erwinia sp. QL-Z3]